MKRRLIMFLASLLLTAGAALAQTAVTGVVISQDDGQPVIGATVQVVGTNVGTVTDANGNFTLTAPRGKEIVKVSYVGMQTEELKVKGNMKIVLKHDNTQLEEVMVVAFGTQKKSAFTGSATVLNTDELQKAQVSNVTSALAGAIPGVQLTQNSGQPGSDPTIRIRGFSSINAKNDPLIIVDGAPYSGDLNNINPGDVESMTVLKDAASNALYGARGANGVIMITTKQAKKGQDAKVTLDAKYGWNTRALQHYDVISNPAQYYEMHYGALVSKYKNDGMSDVEAWQKANSTLTGTAANGGLGYNIWTVPDGQTIIGRDGKLNPNATLGYMAADANGKEYWIYPDDWEDEGTRTGSRQEYNLSINGGSDRGTFYASAGYLKNEGITAKSDFERFTGRLRADYQVKKWLKVGANLSFAHYDVNSLSTTNEGNEVSTANIWAFTNRIAPIYPLYVRGGNKAVMTDANGITMLDYGNGMNAGLNRPFIGDANPIQDNLLNTYQREGNSASATGFIDIDIIEGLKLTLNGTYHLDETRHTVVYNPYYGQFDNTGGTVNKEHDRNYNYNLQQLLNYTRTFSDKHTAQLMLGHEYYDSKDYALYAAKSKMFSQDNKELNGAILDEQSAGSYMERYNNEGYFGRLQYDYDNKIYASASLRRDASSRFAPDHRWGTFWSAGAAWILSKEKFMQSTENWFDMLKVKASIGSQGNDNIGNFRYTDQFNISNSGGEIGTSFKSKGTEDITWETNTNFNVGVEFQMFKRLSGSLEFYHRKTTDMLFAFTVAPSLGYASYYDNVGDLYNQGFELTLNYNAINKKNFTWDVNFNIASLKNRITMLHEDKKTNTFYDAEGNEYKGYTDKNFIITEGESMYTWRLRDYAGVNENGESMWWKNKYETVDNGDGTKTQKWTGRETTTKISEADYYVTGETTVPKFYGGFGTSVQAYGFDLSVNCSFQLGGKQYDATYADFMSSPVSNNTGTNFHKDLLDAWTPQNTGSNIPRFQYNDQYSASMSTRFLTSSSYLNIENINFGYTLPASLLSKIDIEKLRVYLSCENVCYFSARKGFDPRQSYNETANGTFYSPIRTFSVGATVTF
ncbi:SusC/RagA family TonB-linked outer membrane protein [Xylanibacter rodentium]|uniref:SusC/RagA family TonB-linked outer membrane protein n=1 Tax=Xylanibacter rodentium TaxID=2736289 RepID=UPI00258D14EE|nr:TonB-dependent receptor [Xylanibacter rodentium]